jgi:hypothetical protein
MIHSPYAFTALGSAMAFPVWAYKKIGGLTPVLSGEDFYFLQKMVKTGLVLRWNPEKVYPAARFSNRVYFGTGPAMEKGRRGDWESYPIYHFSLFSHISQTYDLFHQLFRENVETPLDKFLKYTFKENNLWNSLRDNYKVEDQFVRACHARLDGLRVLQYLKMEQKSLAMSDEVCLLENFNYFKPYILKNNKIDMNNLSFTSTKINKLDRIRNVLVEIEEMLQKDYSDRFYR